MCGCDGEVGVALGDAEELVGKEVELLVDGSDDALDDFLHGADAGAVLRAMGHHGGGETHGGDRCGGVALHRGRRRLPDPPETTETECIKVNTKYDERN